MLAWVAVSSQSLILLNHIRLTLLHDGSNLDPQIQIPPKPLLEAKYEHAGEEGEADNEKFSFHRIVVVDLGSTPRQSWLQQISFITTTKFPFSRQIV